MDPIYVIGGCHHNTFGVLRSLGRVGLQSKLVIIGTDKCPFLKYSKYVDEFFQIPEEIDAINILLERRNFHKHAVVIACSDGMAYALDAHSDELRPYYSLPGTPVQGSLYSWMNKETMSNLGRSVGFEVPQSWQVSDGNIDGISYPCIAKPLISMNGSKTDIGICKNAEELKDLLHNGSCDCFQVQRFVDKEFEYQLIGLSMNDGSNVIIPGVVKCIRPCRGTNTGFLYYSSLCNFKAPIEKCKSFIKAIGYSGLFSIEFLRDKNGTDFFMEMNFRNDGNSICVTSSGFNLPYIWYLYNTGGNYVDEINKSTVRPVYAMPEFNDFREFVFHKKISLIQWIGDVKKTDVFMIFDKSDLKPFIVELFNILTGYIKKLCGKF